MRIYFLTVLLWIHGVALAQNAIYESVQNGSLAYSDVPSRDSHPYAVNGGNISNFASDNATDNNHPKSSESNSASWSETPLVANASMVYQAITIVQPADQSTFQNQTPIPVSVSIQPALKDGDTVQLLVDGAPYGSAQTGLQFTVKDLIRGTHQIQVRILDKKGQSLQVSPSITIFKQQPSVLLPTNPPPSGQQQGAS